MNKPSPKSMLVAYSLMNDLAYDFKFIYESLFEPKELIDSYILPYHLNRIHYNNNDVSGKYEDSSLFPIFKKNNKLGDLICPNIYALSFLNNNFIEDLKKSNNPDKSFYQLGKVKILWTSVKHFLPKKDPNLSTIISYKSKVETSEIKNENLLEVIKDKYIEVEISLRDLALLNFNLAKKSQLNVTQHSIETILNHSMYYGFSEDEKKTLIENRTLPSKEYNKIILSLVENKDLFTYMSSTFEGSYVHELNAKTLPLLLVEILHENSLYTMSSNLENKSTILSTIFKKEPELIKEAFPMIWKFFTNNDIKEGQSHNFLKNPERIVNILHKLGFTREEISPLDKSLDYFLSNFILENANYEVFQHLKTINLFNEVWLNNHVKIDWNNFQEKNGTFLAEFIDNISQNNQKGVFDLVPKQDQKNILNFMIQNSSDKDISFAINSDNLDFNIFNEIMKITKGKGTYLHKLAQKGHNQAVLNAIANGANMNLPEKDSLIQFLATNSKYEKLLEEVNNFVLYDKLEKKTQDKELPKSNKKKI